MDEIRKIIRGLVDLNKKYDIMFCSYNFNDVLIFDDIMIISTLRILTKDYMLQKLRIYVDAIDINDYLMIKGKITRIYKILDSLN